MLFYWNQVLALQERYKDLQREAKKEYIVRQMLQTPERRHHTYGRVATRLGRQLATWGWRLQERYGAGATGAGVGANNPHPVSGCAMVSCRE